MAKIPASVKLYFLIGALLIMAFLIYKKLNGSDKIISEGDEIINTTNRVTNIENSQTMVELPLRDSIVNFGLELLGTPYKEASCSKDGFDCSGFVFYTFKHFSISVPRSSSAYSDYGKEVPIAEVQKGDVLLFLSPTRNVIGHIGIVSKANGRESEFIHATSGKAMSVVVTSLTNKGYTKRFVKAVSVL